MRQLFSLLLPVFALPILLSAAACDSDQRGCRNDIDCGAGELCSVPTGLCVDCLDDSDCDGGGFCCQGSCRAPEELTSQCGCDARPDGEAGTTCTGQTPVCLAAGAPATPAVVADGVCGCDCDPAKGGSLCLGVNQDGSTLCGCSGADDVGTCGTPALDERGIPHVVADLCAPTGSCVCFGAEAACDPNSTAPDCNAGGCFSLLSDPANCGQAGQTCRMGVCIDGGCGCNAPGDCTGNTNLCVIDQVAQCVCNSYLVNGQPSPCPLALECDPEGCAYEGQHYATDDALYPALGIPLP